MDRKTTAVMVFGAALGVATGCGEPRVRNCRIIDTTPVNNVYDISYELFIPADCPVPLANPGHEQKTVAGRIHDNGTNELDLAYLRVYNSDGERVAGSETVLFNNGEATPQTQYTAATGSETFDDHDIGWFNAYGYTPSVVARGKVEITYQQSSLAASLTGPEIPHGNTTRTWFGPASGGISPYQYQWYRNGAPVGTGSSYTASTGTSDFDLRVEVTDQTWSTRAAVLLVDVDGVRVSIDGPGNVYLSAGGGTWTASGAGGTGPYTYQWYVEGDYVGSGTSWSGYPGQGRNLLHVVMADQNGATDSDGISVTGLGDPNDTCQPVPPQLTCDP